MSWYLKRDDGSVFGPIALHTLYRWATEGRVAPHDLLSQDQADWKPAPHLKDLAMDWFVKLPDGGTYGPMNLFGLRELIEDGTTTLDATIFHQETRREYTLYEALYAGLNQQNAHLRQQLADVSTKLRAAEAQPAPTPAAPEPTAEEDRSQWKELIQARDAFEREAQKWKKLFEKECERAKEREDSVEEEVAKLRESELGARTELEKIGYKLRQLEESHDKLKSIVAGETGEEIDDATQLSAQMAALLESYNELSHNYDTLMTQLAAKSKEIKTILESRAEIEKDASERVRHMENIVQREQDEAHLARKSLAEMEEAHTSLVKAYREMNDQLIRMKQHKNGEAQKRAASRS